MFLKVIEWPQSTPDVIVWKYPVGKDTVERGSSLTVREGQAAVFCDKGRMADVFLPGMYKLDTDTLPVLTRLLSWKYAFQKPFKSDIYFVSTNRFTNMKWGTATPIMVRDKDYGAVRLRAYGTYSFRVADPYLFLKEITGACSAFRTQDITDYIRSLLVTGLSDAVGESGIPVLDLAANLLELGDAVCGSLEKRLEPTGIELTDFRFESVSLPAELEKAIDENARLAMMRGNIDVYTQMAQADAMREAAKNPGTPGSAIGAGLGLGMGMQMAQAFSSAPSAAPAEAKKPASGRVCASCGAAVGAKAKFCPECGKPLSAHCPECGAAVVAGTKFCPECGTKL